MTVFTSLYDYWAACPALQLTPFSWQELPNLGPAYCLAPLTEEEASAAQPATAATTLLRRYADGGALYQAAFLLAYRAAATESPYPPDWLAQEYFAPLLQWQALESALGRLPALGLWGQSQSLQWTGPAYLAQGASDQAAARYEIPGLFLYYQNPLQSTRRL